MKPDEERAMRDHYGYGAGDLWGRIESVLAANGKDLQRLSVEDLTPVDQFHSRGRAATLDLAASSDLTENMRVLDLGGGLGGPARTLASMVGCTVEVLDVTEEFCRAGRELTARTGLTDLVSFTHGSALEIPRSDATFDAVWTQHSTMNIPDKPRLYAEIHRVLKPGGRLAMHEIFSTENREIHFPVPWASAPSISHLTTQKETRRITSEAGLREVVWIDESDEAERWFRKRARAKQSIPAGGAPQLGLALVLGPTFEEMLTNQVKNLAEKRISVARAVFESSKPETFPHPQDVTDNHSH